MMSDYKHVTQSLRNSHKTIKGQCTKMINQMSQVGELNECYFNMQHQIILSMMQNIQELNDKITTAADYKFKFGQY